MASVPTPEIPFDSNPYPDEIMSASVVNLLEYREEHLYDSSAAPESKPQGSIFYEDWKKIESARSDPAALGALIEEYWGFLRFKVKGYFIAGGDADDLMQEASFGLCKAVRDYDGVQSSFRSFAELCVTRQIITAVKTATRRKHAPLNSYVSFSHSPSGQEDDDFTLGDAFADNSRLPEDLVIGAESFNGLLDILTNELSYLEYSVLKMYIEGASYEAMAEELCADTKTVDNAFQRVKRKVLAYQESQS